MSKWVCIKNLRNLIKEGDIVEAGFNDENKFYFIYDGWTFQKSKYWNYFIPLAEWRAKQIDKIFEDE